MPGQHGTKQAGTSDQEANRMLRATRWMWAVMLIGMLTTVGLATVVVYGDTFGPRDRALSLLLPISLAATSGLCAAGYYLRMQTYKRYWVASHVSPHGYYAGNVILFALIYGAALVDITNMVLIGRSVPQALPVVLCVVLLCLNYPNGKPMEADTVSGPPI